MARNGYAITNMINCNLDILADLITRDDDSKTERSIQDIYRSVPLGAAPVGERGRKRDWAEEAAKPQRRPDTRPPWIPPSSGAPSGLSPEAGPSQRAVGCRRPLEGSVTLGEFPFFSKQEKTEYIDTWRESQEGGSRDGSAGGVQSGRVTRGSRVGDGGRKSW